MKRLIASALPARLRTALSGRMRRLHPDQAIAARAFDRAFYLRNNPDVAASGGDPLDHFMQYGWREGRDPSPEFSVDAYLQAFPELADSGVNPFVHWLTSGRPAVRPAESPYGFRYEVIASLKSPAARIPRASTAALDGADRLASALTRARDGLKRLHVTFSHDDYSANLGGLQLSVRREAERLAELGRDHLHLHPARAWPLVRTGDEAEPLGVVWNGAPVGTYAAATVARVLREAAGGDPAGRSFAIHSLLGHHADEVADIVEAAGLSAGVFWLHDFASLCAGFHLLRDDVEDCAAPPPDSAACGICVYGPWRARHLEAHRRLAERLTLTVAAPSQATLDLWARAAPFAPARAVVLPHAELIARGPAPFAEDGPFRMAYAGLPATHKGWPIFRALALKFADDPRYAFLHLGARRDPTLPVGFQHVATGMAAALEAAQPDAVLVWPLCRETFSLVAYEAAAAGAAVITGPDSGNVQAFVAETGQGQVLDEVALFDAFETGEILHLARAQRRPMLHDLRFSALTLDLPA
jgi:glycosyltransferase involved in cell wall biosynthesis